MAAERPTRTKAGRGTPKRSAMVDAETSLAPTAERRYVDVDPWAMLLEGLMEMPEEEPAARTRPKRK